MVTPPRRPLTSIFSGGISDSGRPYDDFVLRRQLAREALERRLHRHRRENVHALAAGVAGAVRQDARPVAEFVVMGRAERADVTAWIDAPARFTSSMTCCTDG